MFPLINFQDHPTNTGKKVFFFKDRHQALHFENLLLEKKIVFEKQIDTEGDQTIYFGVKISDFKETKQLNYLTLGHFRKPFIPDRFARVLLIVFSLLVIALAIAGAILSPN
jgi:hypothetical protein